MSYRNNPLFIVYPASRLRTLRLPIAVRRAIAVTAAEQEIGRVLAEMKINQRQRHQQARGTNIYNNQVVNVFQIDHLDPRTIEAILGARSEKNS